MKKIFFEKMTAVLAASALALSLTACGSTANVDEATTENTDSAETVETESDAEGVTITVEVIDNEGNTTTYEGITDDEFLFDALSDIEGISIDGYESDWGYYITTVNDIVADYDADGAYWSIYVNGAYGEYGVETQPVANGDVFTFQYEVYVAEDTNEAESDVEVEGITITIEVVDNEGNTTTYEGTTDDEFLFDALSDIEGISIDGYEAEWGYYITTVNDVVADYDNDGAYWSIYVNGEYGENGVETQPVADGDVFTFQYEVYAPAAD